MDKQEVIKVLREKLALWDKIIPLMTKATTVAMQKAQAIENLEKDSKRSYQYDSQIKIKKTLPIHNELEIQEQIRFRHSRECLATAKKKFAPLRVFLIVATVIGIIITSAPHLMNLLGDQMDPYLKFASTIGYRVNGMAFQETGFDIEQLTAWVLAIFSLGAQALTVFLAGLSALSSLKKKIEKRVPSFSSASKGLWVAATVIVGIFGLFTWVVTTPVGLVSLAVIIVASLIANASVAKLPDATLPQATPAELQRLQDAKKLDEENRAANEAERRDENEKAKKKFLDEQKKYAKQCKDEIAAYEKEIDQLTDEVAALKKQVDTELLSEKDNNYNTIEQLLNYLENGRADTLKEALYMVDMAKERERDRETQRQIAHMQMENDRFMAQMKRDEERRYNDRLLAQQRDHNERIQREQSRHNAEVEAHNREMERELEKIKRDHNL